MERPCTLIRCPRFQVYKVCFLPLHVFASVRSVHAHSLPYSSTLQSLFPFVSSVRNSRHHLHMRLPFNFRVLSSGAFLQCAAWLFSEVSFDSCFSIPLSVFFYPVRYITPFMISSSFGLILSHFRLGSLICSATEGFDLSDSAFAMFVYWFSRICELYLFLSYLSCNLNIGCLLTWCSTHYLPVHAAFFVQSAARHTTALTSMRTCSDREKHLAASF